MKKTFIAFALGAILNFPVQAVTIKLGVLAPEGTNWAKNMKKMAKEIKKRTEGRVKLKIYFGGSQGDEHDVLRKVRVGQMHGGIFTGKTLGDINGDIRVVEIPFSFSERQKAWKAVESMGNFFDTKFEKNGFVNLGYFEIGQVYLVSQKPTGNLDALKGLKIWSWEGDKVVSTMIDAMNLVSVPLPLPDVLSSLSTGIVEAAYAPPNGMIALQWNTKIKYLVDYPISFSVGAILVEKKRWNKISAEDQKVVREVAAKTAKKVNAATIKENEDALTAIKALGVEFIEFDVKDVEETKKIRKTILGKLKGNMISPEAIQKVSNYL